MTRTRTVHRCQECGSPSPRWVGRCPACGEWGTLVEEVERADVDRDNDGAAIGQADRPVPIADVDPGAWAPMPTGVGELDRVLGGGLVAGSVTLLAGEPGIGKSTLLLQALAARAAAGGRVLLVSGEESKQQVRLRAERLEAFAPSLYVVAETVLPHVLGAIADVAPELVVVDSIQTLHDPDLSSPPGSVAQVRECAHRLVQASKASGLSTVLVGHVTKDGGVAGPRVLEHVVDTVLTFEGDRVHALRLLRARKHRFGPTNELGLFEMADGGLVGVPDAGARFLSDRREGVAGSVVVPTMEGHRPLLVEVQALVTESDLAMPRRAAQGVDSGRLALVLAVLDRRVGVRLSRDDVHASAVGGVRVADPGADLALALALLSSHADVAVADDTVAFGEIGLGGELRQVGHADRRLAEAARLGFRRAVVPAAVAPPSGASIELLRARSVADAVAVVGLDGAVARVASLAR